MRSTRSATVKDVARAAGKSATTVSRALRNHPAIPAETRQKICEIADRLGYKSNPMVRALMTQVRTRRPAHQETIGCLYSLSGLPARSVHEQFVEGVKMEAARIGYAVNYTCLDDPGCSTGTLPRIWRFCRVRGVILYNCRPEAPLNFPWNDFAWVVGGPVTHAPKLERVGNEIFQIVKIGIKELVSRGYRRPALVMPMYGTDRAGFRWAGAFVANALHYGIELSLDSLYREEWNATAFEPWFRKVRPDVVLSLHDEPAQWLGQMGHAIPEEVGYLHLAAANSAFAASGVSQDFVGVGRTAVQVLDGQLRRNDLGIPPEPNSHTVCGTWTEGKTLRPRTGSPTES